jgi:hypothetical protein
VQEFGGWTLTGPGKCRADDGSTMTAALVFDENSADGVSEPPSNSPNACRKACDASSAFGINCIAFEYTSVGSRGGPKCRLYTTKAGIIFPASDPSVDTVCYQRESTFQCMQAGKGVGAPCDDGDSSTADDVCQVDFTCAGVEIVATTLVRIAAVVPSSLDLTDAAVLSSFQEAALALILATCSASGSTCTADDIKSVSVVLIPGPAGADYTVVEVQVLMANENAAVIARDNVNTLVSEGATVLVVNGQSINVQTATAEVFTAPPAIVTTSSARLIKGSTQLSVASIDGFNVGDTITIGEGTPEEETVVIVAISTGSGRARMRRASGTLTLSTPLTNEHPAGTVTSTRIAAVKAVVTITVVGGLPVLVVDVVEVDPPDDDTPIGSGRRAARAVAAADPRPRAAYVVRTVHTVTSGDIGSRKTRSASGAGTVGAVSAPQRTAKAASVAMVVIGMAGVVLAAVAINTRRTTTVPATAIAGNV